MDIKLTNVRLSFANIWHKSTAKGYEDSEPKYSMTVLIDKKDPQAEMIKKAIDQIKKGAHPFPESKWEKVCFFDGDTSSKAEDAEGNRYAGYEGHYAIKLTSKSKFLIVDKDLSRIEEDDNRIYSGCYINVKFSLLGYKDRKAICGFIKGVQFARDGEAFGSAEQSADQMFDNIADAEIQEI
jgi:hypothetical protein